MRKIIQLFSSLNLTIIISTSLIACNWQLRSDVNNLKTQITTLHSINNTLSVDFLKKNSEFDQQILQAEEIEQLRPKINGVIKIQYFDIEKKEITNQFQDLSFLFIKLTATNDSSWWGTTDFLPLNLVRHKIPLKNKNIDLNNFNNQLRVEANQHFNYLDSWFEISEVIQNLMPKLSNYRIDYYDESDKFINNEPMSAGTIYAVITAIDDNDPHYIGSSDKLSLTIYKNELENKKIDSLDGFTTSTKVNPKQKYSDFNNLVIKSSQFKQLSPKINNYDIQYYDHPNGEEITNKYQTANNFYIRIVADNDPYYTGSTQFIPIEILNS